MIEIDYKTWEKEFDSYSELFPEIKDWKIKLPDNSEQLISRDSARILNWSDRKILWNLFQVLGRVIRDSRNQETDIPTLVNQDSLTETIFLLAEELIESLENSEQDESYRVRNIVLESKLQNYQERLAECDNLLQGSFKTNQELSNRLAETKNSTEANHDWLILNKQLEDISLEKKALEDRLQDVNNKLDLCKSELAERTGELAQTLKDFGESQVSRFQEVTSLTESLKASRSHEARLESSLGIVMTERSIIDNKQKSLIQFESILKERLNSLNDAVNLFHGRQLKLQTDEIELMKEKENFSNYLRNFPEINVNSSPNWRQNENGG